MSAQFFLICSHFNCVNIKIYKCVFSSQSIEKVIKIKTIIFKKQLPKYNKFHNSILTRANI